MQWSPFGFSLLVNLRNEIWLKGVLYRQKLVFVDWMDKLLLTWKERVEEFQGVHRVHGSGMDCSSFEFKMRWRAMCPSSWHEITTCNDIIMIISAGSARHSFIAVSVHQFRCLCWSDYHRLPLFSSYQVQEQELARSGGSKVWWGQWELLSCFSKLSSSPPFCSPQPPLSSSTTQPEYFSSSHLWSLLAFWIIYRSSQSIDPPPLLDILFTGMQQALREHQLRQ